MAVSETKIAVGRGRFEHKKYLQFAEESSERKQRQ